MKRKSSGIFTSMVVRGSAVATLVAAFAVVSTAVAAPKPAARMPASAPNKKAKIETPPAVPAPTRDADGKAPKIVCETPVHDFGTSWMGPVLKHTFVIHNKGDAPLEITRVRPSCGCTAAGPHPKVLQPGERGGFPFSIKSTKLRGRYEKSITISTNDPDNPQYKLKLQGYCKRYVDVVPSNATFGKVFGDEPQERILKITNNTDDPIEISVEPKKDGQFTFEIIEKTPGKEYELLVRMEPPFALGQSRNYATIRTSNENQKEIKVAATAHVPPRLDIQPNPIRINERKAEDRGYKRTIRFTNYGKNPVKVLEALVGDTKITAEVTERTSGKAYTIALQIPPGYKIPPGGTTLTLKTDDAQRPTIEIPIQSSARARKTTSTRSRPADALVGKAAPSFSLTTTAGKELSNLTMKDTVTVLDFFAVNCGFCKKQIPRLEKIRQDYEKKGVRFVAVSQTMRKKFSDEDIKAKINDLGFKGELAIDSGNTVGPLFKATGFPTMIVVGKDGKVGAVNIGNVGDLESRMKTQLDALLAGKPVPAMARSASKKPSPTNKPRKRPAEQMVGKPAPSFSLTTTAGKPLSNATCKDKVTVLDFFAVNCGYCKKQIPRLETVRQKYEAKGVRFVTVSQTMRKKFTDDEIKAKIDGLGFKGELAIDSGNTVGPLFKATSFPTMVILGAVNIGNVGDLESRMAKQLDALLAGKPVPTIAAAAKPSKPSKPSLLGKPAPKFSLKTTAGKDLSNASTKDKVTVLNFFAVNCGYCKKQIPRLETIRAEYEKKGVRFVAVSQTMRKKFSDEDIKAKIDGLGFKGELAIDSGNTVGPLFNATGFPTMIVLDKKGNVGAINVGNIGDLETRLKGQLDAMLAGKPVPAKFASTPKKKSRERPATKLVGKPAPKFADFKTLDGKTVSYDGFAKQKATVFNFVAPNCGFCKRALPNVEKVRQAYESKGVRFINVAQTMRKKYPVEEVKKIIDGTGSKLELAYDGDNIVGKLYKAVSFPTMIVVDSKGKVAYVNIGAKKDLEQLLSGQLDTLIKAAQ